MKISMSLLVSLCTMLLATELTLAEEASETTIIVIESSMDAGQTFQVTPAQQVRIPASAIAGSTISAKISGPAEIVAHNRVIPMKENTGPNGEKTLQPLIGTTEHEFLIQPTGPGDVTVTLTSRSPIPGIEPQVKEYHFTVE